MRQEREISVEPNTKVPDCLSRREKIAKNIDWGQFVFHISSLKPKIMNSILSRLNFIFFFFLHSLSSFFNL